MKELTALDLMAPKRSSIDAFQKYVVPGAKVLMGTCI
jgi:hypothetical protein